jgi:hypothetical protein
MSTALLRSLAEIVGPAHCLAGADRAPYVVDGRTPCGLVLPGSGPVRASVPSMKARARSDRRRLLARAFIYDYTLGFALSGPTSINEFRIAYRNYIQARQGQNFDLKPWTLVPAVPVQNTGGLPTVTFSGYSGLSDWGAGIDFPTYDVEFSDNFTKIYGRHTVKAGILETGYKFSVPGSDGRLTIQLGSYNGAFGSTGAWTGGKGFAGLTPSQGNAFADFLLGNLSSTNYATLVNSTLLSSRDWEGYVQDTWQVHKKLTLTLGTAWEYYPVPSRGDRQIETYDFNTNQIILCGVGSVKSNCAFRQGMLL